MAMPPTSTSAHEAISPSSTRPGESAISSILDRLPSSARRYLPSSLVGGRTYSTGSGARAATNGHNASYEPLLDAEAPPYDVDGEGDQDGDEAYATPALGAAGIEGMHDMPLSHKWAVWIAFGLFGAAVLLPFNALITPSEYYRSLFSRTVFKDSFMSWIVITYNAATIAFSAHAMSSMSRTTPARRIFTAKPAMVLSLLGLTLLTSTSNVTTPSSSSVPFLGLLALTFGLAAAGAYLQTAVVALASSFGARAMGSMLAGQGLVGLVLSLIQLSAAWARASEGEGGRGIASTSSVAIADANASAAKAAAVTLYLCSTGVMLLSLVVFSLLRSTSAYGTVVPSSHKSHAAPLAATSTSSKERIRTAQKPILGLSLALAGIFTITLSLFPSLTARIRSVRAPSDVKKGESPRWTDPLLFVSLHFVLFNLSDLIGRLLPSLAPSLCVFESKATIYVLSAARLVFLPLFAGCNVAPASGAAGSATTPTDLTTGKLGDASFILTLLAFGISNGLLSTNTFILGPSSPELSDEQRPTAAAILPFWLSLGLAAGSAASFVVAALV